MPGQRTRGVLLKGVEGMPIQVPQEILDSQARLGPVATLVWINLLALAQLGKPMHIDNLSVSLGLPKWEVSKALALLADEGWINDEGLEIQLALPELMESAASLERPVEVEPEAFEWLVSYWSARVAPASPEEMRKLLYWMETKGLSHEVIAVAIEEMLIGAAQPSFPYLEGILRNWHAVGVRTYNDLLENSHLTKVLAPIAGRRELSPAERKWKEVFPDEFE
ncbi:MAG TPA: DnaD domain protein [Limnochordia bacterium]|nr:DnaD domain protein [Limnochordia bacterium]